MFTKKTIRDVTLNGQKVLVRVDYNVPLEDGRIDDDYRMTQSLPTLQYLLEQQCAVVLCAHLGRPDGQVVPDLSLRPVAEHLGELLHMPVGFVSDCIGQKVKDAAAALQPGQVLLLENLRFHAEEEANDPAFAEQLAKDSGATYFVQDGFGEVHRAHASTVAITTFLPSVAGFLLEKEVTEITSAMQAPKHPLVAILAGAKVSDKIKLLEKFVEIADEIIVGGGIANTFLAYKGSPIGKSLFEESQEGEVGRIYQLAQAKLRGQRDVDAFISLPSDAVVAKSIDENAEAHVVTAKDVAADDMILDLGPDSAAHIVQLLQGAGTVIWNGTLGMAEQPAYAKTSAAVAQALANQPETTSIIGGGDTADFVRAWIREHNQPFGHISTGGGASLELMAGDKLPGVEALMGK
ncbi:MAG TPA: phosphoglycerate kinase [Candidatus Acidoferrum sp.]|nr:phosphoglycerate kinase [Candidatus Acidoferrum sp.]